MLQAVVMMHLYVCFTDRYGGPGVELSGQHDDSAAVFQIFMFDQVFNTVR